MAKKDENKKTGNQNSSKSKSDKVPAKTTPKSAKAAPPKEPKKGDIYKVTSEVTPAEVKSKASMERVVSNPSALSSEERRKNWRSRPSRYRG